MLGGPMPYFRDADDVYAHLGAFLRDLAGDPGLASALERADTTVQFRLRHPESQVTVRMPRGDDPAQVDCGQTELRPEVVLQMDADTAHRLWLGDVNAAVALARGEIRARGPALKILGIVPLVKPGLGRYRASLEAAGRQDLLDVSG
jgi:hypothetical protein